MKDRVEILAPAGSMECLKAAIAAGADAVYTGGALFGARAYAHNLTEEELLEAIDYVHLHGRWKNRCMIICSLITGRGWMR